MILHLTQKQATTEDFNQIQEISDESFEGVERPPIGILWTHFLTDDVFVSRSTGSESTITAFAIVTDRVGGPYIWSIATHPGLRGCGLGTKLLREIEEHYRLAGCQSISLTCKPTNPAQKLYFDRGYRVENVIRGYYGSEGNGLFFRRVL
jgi:ribosomal protein S18 acetylase RimI-like enzyme